jgi:hypothetical protein
MEASNGSMRQRPESMQYEAQNGDSAYPQQQSMAARP